MLADLLARERHHERHQRADRGRHRDPREQQRRDLHRRADPRDPVDEQRGDDRAGERGDETTNPPSDAPRPSTITRIAPSAAPDETPITAGSASGFRNSPWNSTRRGERGAHERRERHPRQPELEQDHLGRAVHASG